MAAPKKTKTDETIQTVSTQELVDRIAELERDKAELAETKVGVNDTPPDVVVQLLQQNAEMIKALGLVAGQGYKPPAALKSRAQFTPDKPYVLTDERKSQVMAIFEKYKGRGIEYTFDKSGSVTFRKRGKIRTYDQDTETWVREEIWKFAESINCSSADSAIQNRVHLMSLLT